MLRTTRLVLFGLAWSAATLEAANDARILSSQSSIPGTVFPGATAVVRVRVQNTGTTAWRAADGYRLGAGANQLTWQGFSCGGYMRNVTDGRVYLCRDVPPGGTHDFNFSIVAPPSAGVRRLAVRMVRDGVEWFGASASFDVNIAAASVNDSAIDVAGSRIPDSIAPGKTARVTVRLRNTGTTVWSPGAGYRLGTQAANQFTWTGFDCGGYMNAPGDGRAFLCRSVSPGDVYDVSFDITAGNAAGVRALAVRMVRDGVAWFGESHRFSIDVEAAPGLPDVVVTSASVVPSLPSPGQAATFQSVVRNVGGAPTPAGVPIGVAYFVDGEYRSWGAVTRSLAPGESLTITTQGGAWSAAAGTHTLTALVDDVDRFAEADEGNNSFSTSFTVGSSSPPRSGELYAMNIDPANPAGRPSAADLIEIGASWVRIEWKASHGFGFYDPILSAYRAAGLRVLLIVDYASVTGSPPSNASDSAWRGYIDRFTRGVSEIAGHYGNGVDAYQIWNEPDLFGPGTGYDPGVRAALYGIMLRDAAAAVRARSTSPVVTAGLASGNPGYLAEARNAVGGIFADAVAVHPYGQRAPDDWPNPSWGFGNMSTLFERYLAFGLPLWVTEIGTIDTSNQAAYLENVYELARDRFAGRVSRVFWFCWSDGMVPPYGVLTSTGDRKPAYWQYRAVSENE